MKILSPIASAWSGSVAGLTGARNAGGLYLRARATPVNPQTAFQLAIRNAVTQLTSHWGDTLTQAQRDSWDVYGVNVTVTDRLGQSRNLSGQQHYVRSNVPRLQAGLDRVDDAPTTFDLGTWTYVAPDLTDSATEGVAIQFDADDPWVDVDGSALLTYVSRPQSVGKQFFKGPYRFAGMAEGDSVTPPTTPALVAPPFPLAEGDIAFVQQRLTQADGRLSGVSRTRVVVEAAP